MSSSLATPLVAAAAAAAVGCAVAPQLFVPSVGGLVRGNGSSGLRGRQQAASKATPHSSSSAVPLVSFSAAAGLSAVLSTRGKSSKLPVGAFENELGVQAPVGFFDPMGLSADGDIATFKRRRSTELKHGRIAMLATMGYITPEVTGKFPGYLSYTQNLKFYDVPNGLGALAKVPAFGWIQIIAYMAFCEVSPGIGADVEKGRPGDFGFYALTSSDPAEKTQKLNAELANGRLAMMAIIGMFYQDGLTGSAWGDWALYTDSPLRAFENELGVQAPVGFFDPMGLSADGDIVT